MSEINQTNLPINKNNLLFKTFTTNKYLPNKKFLVRLKSKTYFIIFNQ
jgi:hypothetical protein